MKKRQQFSTIMLVTAILLVITSGCKKNGDDDPSIIKDGDGNIYQTVTIGNQVWLKENLKTTKYNDGTPINDFEENDDWWQDRSGAYCWYNNDEEAFKNVYGALYNWYAANSSKLCPKGFRVPSSGDWEDLATSVGGMDVAGGMLKEMGTTHWDSPNTEASDSYGFAALGGGFRDEVGAFFYIKLQGLWWTTTKYNDFVAQSMYTTYGNKELFSDGDGMTCGYSIRCIKE